eukprot:11754040-Karenia_brevis.AAC.1
MPKARHEHLWIMDSPSCWAYGMLDAKRSVVASCHCLCDCGTSTANLPRPKSSNVMKPISYARWMECGAELRRHGSNGLCGPLLWLIQFVAGW